MSVVLRITDRFKITGRGIVYIVKRDVGTAIRVGDIFYDLQGYQFRIKAIEILNRLRFEDFETAPIGIMFELMDEVDVQGNILVSDLRNINFLFCNHPIYSKRVDEDYEEEYQYAGLNHACALFRYEDMEKGKLSLYGEDIVGLTVCRGWMMKPDMYRNFYVLLEQRGIILINSSEE